MLFGRLASFVAVLSLTGSVLAAPTPKPDVEVKPLKCLEAELEKEEGGGFEIEIESNCKWLPIEIELEIKPKKSTPKALLRKRAEAELSLSGSILAAQKQLDTLKVQIDDVMAGPMGSIERKASKLMTNVHGVVNALTTEMGSFSKADATTLYRNPSGDSPLTDADLAKIISTFLLRISEIEKSAQHVSGYAFTSAQQNIRQDLLSMKTLLSTLVPNAYNSVASMMAMAMTMGTGAAGIIA